MPRKVRELKARLLKAGFTVRPGKGSLTVWEHPEVAQQVTLSGKDGDDAKPYQELAVRKALRQLGETL
jgi:predicted RNA binding protein YcfA (HicA-like mRNA interferase family)